MTCGLRGSEGGRIKPVCAIPAYPSPNHGSASASRFFFPAHGTGAPQALWQALTTCPYPSPYPAYPSPNHGSASVSRFFFPAHGTGAPQALWQALTSPYPIPYPPYPSPNHGWDLDTPDMDLDMDMLSVLATTPGEPQFHVP